ncbi:DNA polymerase thumb domain-containing protein [Streptomyces sp. NPDC001450]
MMLAAMACALTPLDRRTVIDDFPEAITDFLRPHPVRELPGVGTRTAATLAEYGLHTVGDVADVPQLTLQHLLGARAGRTLHERAQGRDTQLVDLPTPASVSTEHRFAQDELDPAARQRALLALADDLGALLRASRQIATGVHLHDPLRRCECHPPQPDLPEASQHTVFLARAAYAVYDFPWAPARSGPRHRAARRRTTAGRPSYPASRTTSARVRPAVGPRRWPTDARGRRAAW